MAGAQFKSKNEAPRATPIPSTVDLASSSLGAPIKNFPENHPSIAESFTSSTENSTPAAPITDPDTLVSTPAAPITDPAAPAEQPAAIPVTPEMVDQLVGAGENEFYVPAAQPAPVPKAQLVKIEKVKEGEYHPGIIDQMYAYFDRPKMREVVDTYTWKTGAVSERSRFIPNTPPHFSEFARMIGVSTRKLKSWASKYPDFKDAYDTCQEIFEEFLIDNGLTGAYGAIAMKFVAVNRSKMKDKQVHENQTLNMNDVLDKIAAGKVKPGGLLEAGDLGGD